MIIEMVGYKVIHSSTEDSWRCMVCPGSQKFTMKTIMEHLTDFHNFDDEYLVHYPTGEIFKEVPELDEENSEIVLELEDEEELFETN